MKKIAAVTGGAGFIGSHLADALMEDGYEVRVVDTKVGKVPPSATLHAIDVRDTDALVPILKDAQILFHEAALPSVPFSIKHPAEAHDVNVNGTLSVLLAARDAKVRRVIFASSAAIYGNQKILPVAEDAAANPGNPYGLHKYIGEWYMRLFAQLFGIETVSLRYFNVYGPGMDPKGPYGAALARFLDQKKKGEALTIVGDGTQTRDFVHIADVVRANLLAAESPRVGKGGVINIGTGRNLSVNAIADLFGGKRTTLPPRLEIHDSQADIRLAKKLLGWEPAITLEDGIAELRKEGTS